jgi:hypothetical protein
LKEDFEMASGARLLAATPTRLEKDQVSTWRPEFPFAFAQNNYPVVNITEFAQCASSLLLSLCR